MSVKFLCKKIQSELCGWWLMIHSPWKDSISGTLSVVLEGWRCSVTAKRKGVNKRFFLIWTVLKENKILYDRKSLLTKCFDLRENLNRTRSLSLPVLPYVMSHFITLSICASLSVSLPAPASTSITVTLISILFNSVLFCLCSSQRPTPSESTAYSVFILLNHIISHYYICSYSRCFG